MRNLAAFALACSAATVVAACGGSPSHLVDGSITADGRADGAVAADAPPAGPDAGCAPRVGCGSSAGVTIKQYNSEAMFQAALAALCVRRIGFDDVDTTGPDPVAIAADRYAASDGVVITGTSMQYVDESFATPTDFVPKSAPNMYAPGPIAGVNDPSGSGGHDTDVTFVAGGAAGCVAGFAATFIDVDYRVAGKSSLAVYDASDALLDLNDTFSGGNAAPVFVGAIAFDAGGNPAPVIKRVHLVNGNEYPTVYAGEGVTLDDFELDQPAAP